MKNRNYAIFMALMCCVACSGGKSQLGQEFTYNRDSVIVRSDSHILSKLRLESVASTPFSNEFRTVGTVEAENGKFAEVGVPFDGRVIRSLVSLGKRVRAGEPLFEFSSPELIETIKLYFQAKRTYETEQANYNRKKQLSGCGIVSQRELEEAFASAENAKREVEYSESSLRVYGVNPSTLTMSQNQTIKAPISGEVVMSRVTPGSFVKADSEPLLAIADLNRVWVTAQVKERFIDEVKLYGSVEVFTEANPDDVIIGKVINVGNLVDPETRSVQVVISCDNKETKLKHGMFVSVHFISEPENSILVPTTAVFQGEESSYIYVAGSDKNHFIRRSVILGQSNDDNSRIVVKSGLTEGELIISEGGLYLNN